jgi:hypothetical protein
MALIAVIRSIASMIFALVKNRIYRRTDFGAPHKLIGVAISGIDNITITTAKLVSILIESKIIDMTQAFSTFVQIYFD